MTRDRFIFEDLDLIEARLRRLSEDAAYLVLQDRTVKGKDVRLGRFDLTEVDARPWIDDADPNPLSEREEDDEWQADPADQREEADADADLGEDPDLDPEDVDDPDDDLPAHEAELSWGQIKQAAILWVRDTAIRNTAGRSRRRFRLKIMGPKASAVVDSGHFGCQDRSYRPHRSPIREELEPDPAALPELPPLPPVEDMGSPDPGDPVQALGRYYTQFGHLVLGTIGQLQGINNSMTHRLSSDLNRSRDQVEELVGAILESRAAQVEQAHSHAIQHTQVDARTALAREAISNFGEAARAALAIPNLPPEMLGLAKVVGQNPELLRTLNDPAVQALLADPGHVSMLGDLLKHFAAQAQAMRQAPAQPGGLAPAPAAGSAPASAPGEGGAHAPGSPGAPAPMHGGAPTPGEGGAHAPRVPGNTGDPHPP